ncbi:hypothetical protein Tco_1231759, partial [Tanacetum coccineum]
MKYCNLSHHLIPSILLDDYRKKLQKRKDERDSDVEGSDGESDSDKEHKVSEEADVSNESEEEGKCVKTKVFKGKEKVVVSKFKKNKEVEADVEGNESEEDSESEEDKETKVSKESDNSDPGVKDVKIKGVKCNKTVVVSKAKKRMHVSDSFSKEDKVSKLKKVSKKKKQVKDVKKQKHASDSSSYDDSSSSEEEKVLKPKKFSKKKSASSYEFKLEKGIIRVTPEKVYEILGVPLGGTSIFDLLKIPLDDPFVKEWFKQFDPKPLKEIRACD